MYITKNPERVCLVLHGLDQIHVECCSDFIQNVMDGIAVNMAESRVFYISRRSETLLIVLRTYYY